MLSGISVVNQYQRRSIDTRRFTGVREPLTGGCANFSDDDDVVDVRSTPIDVPKQEVNTKDNVTVGVDAVVYFRVIDAPKAVLDDQLYLCHQPICPSCPARRHW